MDEDKGNPNSQPPSPSPSWLEDEALSGQCLGAVGGSDLPLSETEEGAFAHMDDDWIYDTQQDLSPRADVTTWEEHVTLQELYRWEERVRVQERSQRGARRRQELYEFEEDVRARELSQWRDGRQPELHQWEESVRRQELNEWEEDGVRYHELTLWEERVTGQEVSQREEEETYQELSQWGDVRGQELSQRGDVGVRELSQREGERDHDLPQGEEDVQGHGLDQWKDKRDPELSQVGDKTDKEQSQEENYSAQELPQREDRSEQKLSQGGDDVGYNTWDKPWCPVNAGDPQPVPQEGPSSASSVGTEVAAEAARDLPSPAPAPVSTTDTEPAAAAPAGAAEEEEPQGPLTPEEEEAEGSPTFREQVPSAGTQSPVPAPHSPSEASEVLLDTNQSITSEIVRRAELVIQGSGQELEEQRDLEQTTAIEMGTLLPAERPESPVPAPQSPPESSQALLDVAKLIVSEIVRKAVLVFQGSGQQPEEQRVPEQSTATEMATTITEERTESPVPAPQSPCSPSSPSPSQVEAQALSEQEEGAGGDSVLAVQGTDEGPFPGEGINWKYYTDQEVSQWEGDRDQEVSQEEINTYQEVSQWEDHIEQEVQSHEVKRDKELPDREEYSEEEQSHGKGSSSPEMTHLEECIMKAQPQRKCSNYQELLSDWEDSIAEELSQDEDSFGQDFSDWEDYRPSVLSRWEDDSDRELALADWEHMTVHSFGAKPLLPEEDEWEELSVLELSQGQGTEHRLRVLAEEGLPVPVPREAWAERRAPAPCTQVPVCASPPQLEALSPGGTEAPPAFAEQVAEAGTQSPVPAPRSPCCPPSPSPPQLEAQALSRQLALPRKRLSRFRRALGALRRLFRSCTAPQPQD